MTECDATRHQEINLGSECRLFTSGGMAAHGRRATASSRVVARNVCFQTVAMLASKADMGRTAVIFEPGW